MLKKLHHVAYRCLDAEQTRRFYEDVLGLKCVAALVQDYVPSLKRNEPHNHIFFEMEDGSYIAFFDILEDSGPAAPPQDWAQHLALEVGDHDTAEAVAARLRAAGTEVLGPVPHGICDSWYFYDPNGHRLEMAVRTDSRATWDELAGAVPEQMELWSERKREGADATA